MRLPVFLLVSDFDLYFFFFIFPTLGMHLIKQIEHFDLIKTKLKPDDFVKRMKSTIGFDGIFRKKIRRRTNVTVSNKRSL